jgi:hypothetical protein
VASLVVLRIFFFGFRKGSPKFGFFRWLSSVQLTTVRARADPTGGSEQAGHQGFLFCEYILWERKRKEKANRSRVFPTLP